MCYSSLQEFPTVNKNNSNSQHHSVFKMQSFLETFVTERRLSELRKYCDAEVPVRVLGLLSNIVLILWSLVLLFLPCQNQEGDLACGSAALSRCGT